MLCMLDMCIRDHQSPTAFTSKMAVLAFRIVSHIFNGYRPYHVYTSSYHQSQCHQCGHS